MTEARAVLDDFYERWGRAHSQRDIDALVALYAPDALFFGSTPTLRVGPDGIRDYFEVLPPQPEADVDFEVLHVTSPGAGVVAGASIGTFRWTDNPGTAVRFTHTLVRRHDTWLVSVHHASPA
ncbi:nuclear transport factor 2 family protein [Nocardioides halotolerans]|jgi:uncharacterized protein (TIGR02246 family)|uniref:nuclear transport factor 2 family protein n=1 Tax=Nocardioides halotolerans TaxID=433660 RepID=UPI000410F09D|nr:nuclear transport factor 2 family protein [Nocardioides halotolerans]